MAVTKKHILTTIYNKLKSGIKIGNIILCALMKPKRYNTIKKPLLYMEKNKNVLIQNIVLIFNFTIINIVSIINMMKQSNFLDKIISGISKALQISKKKIFIHTIEKTGLEVVLMI